MMPKTCKRLKLRRRRNNKKRIDYRSTESEGADGALPFHWEAEEQMMILSLMERETIRKGTLRGRNAVSSRE
jgi:hypothetical protein